MGLGLRVGRQSPGWEGRRIGDPRPVLLSHRRDGQLGREIFDMSVLVLGWNEQ